MSIRTQALLLFPGVWLAAAAAGQSVPEGQAAPQAVALVAPQAAEDRASRLERLLAPLQRGQPRSRPQWVEERRGTGLRDTDRPADSTPVWVVVQEGRSDGPDLLTLRRVIGAGARLRTYCGAGLHQAVYLEEAVAGPTVFSARGRQRSLGAAAELGAELALGAGLRLDAGLRWAGFAGDAAVLRTEHGMVDADPLAASVVFGWRFR